MAINESIKQSTNKSITAETYLEDGGELAQYRKTRMQDFVDLKFEGNKASLGRALGYRDGAFVRQMLRGERPITEKTIDQIHGLPGGSGWFTVGETAGIVSEPKVQHLTAKRPSHSAVILQLAELLRSMDKTDREMAKTILINLADNPEKAALMAGKFEHMFGERGARRTECGGIGTARIYQFRLIPENPFP